jgi:hypothetical protein
LLGCLTSEIGKSGIAWKLKSTFKWGVLSVSDEFHLVNIEVSSIIWVSDARSTRWFSLFFPSEIYIICARTEHLTYCIGAPVLPLISKILLRMDSFITHYEISWMTKIKFKRKAWQRDKFSLNSLIFRKLTEWV